VTSSEFYKLIGLPEGGWVLCDTHPLPLRTGSVSRSFQLVVISLGSVLRRRTQPQLRDPGHREAVVAAAAAAAAATAQEEEEEEGKKKKSLNDDSWDCGAPG
jgi:hypothetical protein